MKKVILGVLLGFSAYAQTPEPDLHGHWRGETSGDIIQLGLQRLSGHVTGSAVLYFAWNSTDRHLSVKGQVDAKKATLHLLDSAGKLVYEMACNFTNAWTCTLYAETGVTEPAPGTAVSAARAWLFPLNAVQ